jgi:hypothetical protein
LSFATPSSRKMKIMQQSESFRPERPPRKKLSNMRNSVMKDEYDFSKGERGKFYRTDIKLNMPIYLDDEVMNFVEKIAKEKDADLSSVVNQLLRGDMQLAEVIK